MDQSLTADIIRAWCQVLGIIGEVCYFLLRKTSAIDNLALLVDFVTEVAYILKGRSVAVHDSLLVQASPIQEQDGQVRVVARVLVHDKIVTQLLYQVLVLIHVVFDNRCGFCLEKPHNLKPIHLDAISEVCPSGKSLLDFLKVELLEILTTYVGDLALSRVLINLALHCLPLITKRCQNLNLAWTLVLWDGLIKSLYHVPYVA